jgi:16S rRNA (guanine527-N7)-methyltransferase
MLSKATTREEVLMEIGATTEHIEKLDQYVALLEEWQKGLSLIGPGTVDQIWQRHILDSAQLKPHIDPSAGLILDIGSGAGFPGLVLAILYGDQLKYPIKLVESDGRKCRFLETVIAETDAKAMVVHDRLEHLELMWPYVAALNKLLIWTERQQHPGLTCLFMKGKKANEELTALKNYPKIKVTTTPSITHPDGMILRLNGFRLTRTIRPAERSAKRPKQKIRTSGTKPRQDRPQKTNESTKNE